MSSRLSKTDSIVRELVNLQLRKYGVDYDFVIDNPQIEGENWFSYYTFTEEEYQKFKAEAIEIIREQLKVTPARAKKEYDWFNLSWGLRIE